MKSVGETDYGVYKCRATVVGLNKTVESKPIRVEERLSELGFAGVIAK